MDYCAISIHAPRVGCDFPDGTMQYMFSISIHAPRVGCDLTGNGSRISPGDFNPRTPRGVRQRGELADVADIVFQSTHPVWGATWILPQCPQPGQNFNPRTPCGVRRGDPVSRRTLLVISIHAPRVGCDASFWACWEAGLVISIHAPRVGCDLFPYKIHV